MVINPKYFMCPRHWRMVSPLEQARIWRHYRNGQEVDKRVTVEYMKAVWENKIYVCQFEHPDDVSGLIDLAATSIAAVLSRAEKYGEPVKIA